jgi:hypothetical protein
MIPRVQNRELVVIILEKNKVTWAALRPGSHKLYTLTHSTTLSVPCFAQTGSLIQTTALGMQTAAFLRKYGLERSVISIVCVDPLIQEGFATTVTASAHNYLQHNLALPHTQLNTLYLGPYKESFLHWWHRISYPLTFQLHLLSYRHKLNIVRVVSAFPPLLELYKKIRGATFHPVQLITDLENNHFELREFFDPSLIKNFLYYDAAAGDASLLPIALGAALYEELK